MHSDAPRALPGFLDLLAHLPGATPTRLARHLGVTVRTIHRWIAAGEAPRAVCLALFWETPYGRSAVECRAVNDAMLQAQAANALRREAEARLADVQRLLAVGDFGSANDPLADVAAPSRSVATLAAAREAVFPERAVRAAKPAVKAPRTREAAPGEAKRRAVGGR